MRKIKVGILFGGKSAEHEVSLRSAKNVIDAIDKKKYDVVPIGIEKSGQWLLGDSSNLLIVEDGNGVALIPQSDGDLIIEGGKEKEAKVDVVFPILHGPFGEDGTVQGLLKLANIPFVGAGVLGSAVGMDKDIMKRLLRDAGIPTSRFLSFKRGDKVIFKKVKAELGLPLFIKPANMGSSVGINKVNNEEDFKKAVQEAFEYDLKIVIEEFIKGRELECSVLGNDDPIASVPGEVVPNHDFYSYEAKYLDESGAVLEIPAKVSKETRDMVRALAVKAFKVLSCEGLGRVDFFLKDNGDLTVIEINTIPGFTSISMYPRLWEASGVSYTELIDKLIQLAIDRFDKEQKLKTSFV